MQPRSKNDRKELVQQLLSLLQREQVETTPLPVIHRNLMKSYDTRCRKEFARIFHSEFPVFDTKCKKEFARIFYAQFPDFHHKYYKFERITTNHDNFDKDFQNSDEAIVYEDYDDDNEEWIYLLNYISDKEIREQRPAASFFR